MTSERRTDASSDGTRACRRGRSFGSRLGGATVLILALAGQVPAFAAEGAVIASEGTADGVPACSACHGSHGEGNLDLPAPRLAGLNGSYLAHELSSFATGSRQNEVMTPIAQSLTPDERDAVASYFGALPPASVASSAPAPDAALVAAGAALADRGDWVRGLPACSECHAARGGGIGSAFPAVAGQPAAYLSGEIEAWQDGARADDPMGLMRAIAVRMSPADVAATSAYYAALPADGRHSPPATGAAP